MDRSRDWSPAEAFKDRESALVLVQGFCELRQPNSGIADVDRVLAAWQLNSAIDAVEIAFNVAESPIERQFLCSVVLSFLIAAPTGYLVTPPMSEALDQIRYIREVLAAMDEIDVRLGAKRGSKNGFYSIASSEEERARYLRYCGMGYDDSVHITPQAGIVTPSGKRFRVDFLAWVPSRPTALLALECDGFEWHRSQGRFAADRARDRELKFMGIHTLRFAGTEIHNDPVSISKQAVEHLLKLTAK